MDSIPCGGDSSHDYLFSVISFLCVYRFRMHMDKLVFAKMFRRMEFTQTTMH